MSPAEDAREVLEQLGVQSMGSLQSRSPIAGVRLFAFRSRKRDLTCEELAHGKREADGAPAALNGPHSGGLSPAQKSRGTMLAAEVSKELTSEMRRRGCRVRT